MTDASPPPRWVKRRCAQCKKYFNCNANWPTPITLCELCDWKKEARRLRKLANEENKP